MLSKPYDIVIIFALVAAVVITVGFGLSDVQNAGANTGTANNFFNNVNDTVYSEDYFYGTTEASGSVLDGSEGSGSEPSEENIITEGYNSLRKITGTYKAFRNALSDGSGSLGIDPVYLTLVTGVIIVIMFVLIYTWARGR